jgi:GT2 family glycosyltransferase
MRSVMILTPAYGGIVTAGFHRSLLTSTIELLADGIALESEILENQSLLPLARNTLLNEAYKRKPDDIIWIDTDMVWEPDTLRKLLKHDVDVVGSACRKKIPDNVQFNFQLFKDKSFEPDEKGLIEVRRLGTGFLRMSRKAYTHLWENDKKYEVQGVMGSNVFEIGIWQGRELLSEDFIVCEKLIQHGFKIFMDPELTVGHIGTFNYWADAKDFFKKLKEQTGDKRES